MGLFDGGIVGSVQGQVAAEFSQIYLRVGNDGTVHIPGELPLGLVRENDAGQVMLTTVRQAGKVSAEAQVFAGKPALDSSWSDVVEFSITAGAPVSIDPWDPGGTGFAVPLTPGVTYRVRFVVVDGEAGAEQFRDDPRESPTESYLLQFWPEPSSTAVVLKSESPWARYWVESAVARSSR